MHRNGNKYHTLTDAIKSVIYYIEIVEFSDKPKLGPHSTASFEYELKHKVNLILLRSTEPILTPVMLWKWTVVWGMLLLWHNYGKGVCIILHT